MTITFLGCEKFARRSLGFKPIRFTNNSRPSQSRRYGSSTMPVDGKKIAQIIDNGATRRRRMNDLSLWFFELNIQVFDHLLLLSLSLKITYSPQYNRMTSSPRV